MSISSSRVSARRPDFFLVGAPKCGTTAMSLYLSRHPSIFMPEFKELNFFGSDLKYQLPYLISPARYAAFFAAARDECLVGESSVMYLYSRKAAEEIHAYNPDARILIMLRNPVEATYAHHSQLVSTADEDILNFEAALAAEERRQRGEDIPLLTSIVDYLFYKKIMSFSEQVRRYFNVFGPAQVHVIIFDDFCNDTIGCYQQTLRFLDIDPYFKPDFEVVNASRAVRCAGMRNFIKNPPALIRIPVKRLTPNVLRRRLRVLAGMLNTQEAPRPPMDAALRQRLNEKFRPEVSVLSTLLDRDLMHWVSPEAPAFVNEKNR